MSVHIIGVEIFLTAGYSYQSWIAKVLFLDYQIISTT